MHNNIRTKTYHSFIVRFSFQSKVIRIWFGFALLRSVIGFLFVNKAFARTNSIKTAYTVFFFNFFYTVLISPVLRFKISRHLNLLDGVLTGLLIAKFDAVVLPITRCISCCVSLLNTADERRRYDENA